MTIEAKIIADSISDQGIRLTTFQVVCHRFILPEVNTHRMFSRNWASSRAIPTAKLIQMVRENPATPIHWGKNQPGMQAHAELDATTQTRSRDLWRYGAQTASFCAEQLAELGAHKQLVNRVLEPYLWVRGVITATDFANFYELRRHEDAQPEIKALADAMWFEHQMVTPTELQPGEWHLPYVSTQDRADAYSFCKHGRITRDEPPIWEIRDVLLKASVARIARVSYDNHDGSKADLVRDARLHDQLLASKHMSPFEHQATPDSLALYPRTVGLTWMRPEHHGNFRGWIQHRKLLQGEFVAG